VAIGTQKTSAKLFSFSPPVVIVCVLFTVLNLFFTSRDILFLFCLISAMSCCIIYHLYREFLKPILPVRFGRVESNFGVDGYLLHWMQIIINYCLFGQSVIRKIFKFVATRWYLLRPIALNSISAGALPQIPLGSLHRSPTPLSWI